MWLIVGILETDWGDMSTCGMLFLFSNTVAMMCSLNVIYRKIVYVTYCC